MMDTPSNPKTKFLVVIRGKGTRNEQRIGRKRSSST
jgi:hypothetical protein